MKILAYIGNETVAKDTINILSDEVYIPKYTNQLWHNADMFSFIVQNLGKTIGIFYPESFSSPSFQREMIIWFKAYTEYYPNTWILFYTMSPFMIDDLEYQNILYATDKYVIPFISLIEQNNDKWAMETLSPGEMWGSFPYFDL